MTPARTHSGKAAAPRPYHHGDLERALHDAALDAVRAGGAESFSLRQVAGQVGVSPSAAYAHFPDKASLLEAVGTTGFALLAQRMQDAVDGVPGDDGAAAAGRLFALGIAYTDFATDEPHLFRLMFGTYCAQDKTDITAALAAGCSPEDILPATLDERDAPTAYGFLHAALEDLQAHGLLRVPNGPYLEAVVWSVVHGMSSLFTENHLQLSHREPMLAVLRGLLMPG